jgi:cytochrome P450
MSSVTENIHRTRDEVVERARSFFLYDPTNADVHTFFAGLREHCPVARSEAMGGFWILSRYEHMAKVMLDQKHFSSSQCSIPYQEDIAGPQIPLQIDPPEHTGYRLVINPLFTQAKVAELEDDVRDRLRGYLQQVVANGGGELVSEVCLPHPAVTFALLLGVPIEDADMMVDWNHKIIREGYSGDPVKAEYAMTVVRPAVAKYFDEHLNQRESNPNAPDDLLTALARGRFGDRPLSRPEQLNLLQFLLQGGLETVTSSLSMILWHLSVHPEHRKMLIDEPALIPNAVEEFLRYYSGISPVRLCKADIEIAGTVIKTGDAVLLPTPSGSRDELQFADGETLDFRRSTNKHLGFGRGPHHCVGSTLARMELRVALEETITLMPHFELAPGFEAKWRWGISLGIDELQIVVTDG